MVWYDRVMEKRFWNVFGIVMYILLIGGIFSVVLSDVGQMNGWLSGYEADLLWSRGFWIFVIGSSMVGIRYIFLGK